jgi:hypothetical protein
MRNWTINFVQSSVRFSSIAREIAGSQTVSSPNWMGAEKDHA